MTNLNVSASTNSTYTATGNTTNNLTGGWYCQIHGSTYCTCNSGTGQIGIIWCPSCNQSHPANIIHICPIQFNTWTTSGATSNFVIGSQFKDVKEITSDSELIYEWSGTSFDMKLPLKFSDCFLKVGYAWSPLYPLIFSSLDNDDKTISFHLVKDVTDKIFYGDKVVLKSVTTTKIEDNLTLMQLCQRTKEFFKDDSPR